MKNKLEEVFHMEEDTKQTKPVDGSGGWGSQAGVPRFVSIAELMASMGISRSSINRQIKAGAIPSVRIGNRILIPCSYLETLKATAEATTKEMK
jgi:excisionase family DNA binding protein